MLNFVNKKIDVSAFMEDPSSAGPSANNADKKKIAGRGDRISVDRLIDFHAVQRRVPAARSTIYSWIKIGQFPPGRLLSKRKRMWTESEIDRFIAGTWEGDPP